MHRHAQHWVLLDIRFDVHQLYLDKTFQIAIIHKIQHPHNQTQLSRPGPLEPRESSWRPPFRVSRDRIRLECGIFHKRGTSRKETRPKPRLGRLLRLPSHKAQHGTAVTRCLYLFDMAFFMHFMTCPRLGHGLSCTGCLSRDQVLSSIHSLPLWFHLMNLIAYFRVDASCLCKSHISMLPACPFSVSPSWSSLSSIASILAFASSIIEIQQSSQSLHLA